MTSCGDSVVVADPSHGVYETSVKQFSPAAQSEGYTQADLQDVVASDQLVPHRGLPTAGGIAVPVG